MTYQDIVNTFQQAAQDHLAIKSFSEGTIDKLDSTSQNVEYPYMFLRPLTSNGLLLNENGWGANRILSFEMYMLDVPHLTDDENLKIFSNCEQYIYDIISYFNFGTEQQVIYVTLAEITPVAEAFENRCTGWVATVNVTAPLVLNYCEFPQL
jgi:hypothetical protein